MKDSERQEQMHEELNPEDETICPGEDSAPQPDRVAELEQQLAARTSEAQDYYQQLLRSQADFDNYRKRTRREIEQAGERAVERLVCDFLPIVDNLERALAASETPGAGLDGLLTGVSMVHRQIIDVFAGRGIKAISAVGEMFDPTRHHAVATDASGDFQEGTVVNEIQKGYLFYDRVIRPSMVRVAGKPAPEEKENVSEEGEGNG